MATLFMNAPEALKKLDKALGLKEIGIDIYSTALESLIVKVEHGFVTVEPVFQPLSKE